MRARLNPATAGKWLGHNIWLIIVFFGIMAGVCGLWYGLNQQTQTKVASQESVALEQRLITSGNRHHAQNVRQQNLIISLQMQVAAGQVQGHQTLDSIQALQTEFNNLLSTATPALVNGQNDLLAKFDALDAEVNGLCKATPGCIP